MICDSNILLSYLIENSCSSHLQVCMIEYGLPLSGASCSVVLLLNIPSCWAAVFCLRPSLPSIHNNQYMALCLRRTAWTNRAGHLCDSVRSPGSLWCLKWKTVKNFDTLSLVYLTELPSNCWRTISIKHYVYSKFHQDLRKRKIILRIEKNPLTYFDNFHFICAAPEKNWTKQDTYYF